jgi:hypothetical protein
MPRVVQTLMMALILPVLGVVAIAGRELFVSRKPMNDPGKTPSRKR